MTWFNNVVSAVLGRRSFSNPSPEVLAAFGAQPSRAGVEVSERTVMSVSAVFACIRNLGEDVAKLPFRVYRQLEPRGKERLPQHPLYRLLNDSPNPEQTAFEVRQCLTAMALLWGNGRAEIERTKGGRPLALWPIEPWRIRPRRNAAGTLYYDVDGGKKQLAQEDVFDLCGFSVCGIVGEMVARHGRDSFGLTIAADRFAAGYFGNGARTSGVITHPTKLSPKAYENLARTWGEQYAGVDNAHKTPILEEGAKYEPTTTPPGEAQMVESRQFQVEDVARWFRMPPHKIGHLERAQGWSTLESANSDYVIDTLMSWFVRWEQESKRKLIATSESDVFGEHLVDGMLRGDTTARYAAYTAALNTGWLCIDEVREIENKNPVPGGYGGKFRVPLNTKPIDQADAPKPAPVPATPPPATSPDVKADPKVDPAADPADDGSKRAYRLLVADAVRRVLRVEADKVRRAAVKPDFANWARTFYAGHAEHVGNCLNPVRRAFGQAEFDARGYADRALDELTRAIDTAGPAEIPAAVEELVTRWEADKPAAIALQATEGTKTPQ